MIRIPERPYVHHCRSRTPSRTPLCGWPPRKEVIRQAQIVETRSEALHKKSNSDLLHRFDKKLGELPLTIFGGSYFDCP
jgi:hypothetical protein